MIFADVNGDGRINSLDLAAVRQRLNTALPAAVPQARSRGAAGDSGGAAPRGVARR